jgi:outer membrane protein assembly factor BamB/orotate phosphoribosyltransferase-like protein
MSNQPTATPSSAFRRVDVIWLPELTAAVRAEVERNDGAWLLDIGRQQTIQVQRHTQSIFLRRGIRPHKSDVPLNDVHDSEPTAAASRFPLIVDLLSRFAAQLGGALGRALLVRLAPESVVYPHVDEGAYYRVRDRYHYVIDSPSGSILTAGDETVTMKAGELWWFDNKRLHSSRNDGSGWRVHLIFDLLPGSGSQAFKEGGQFPIDSDLRRQLAEKIRTVCIRRATEHRLTSADGKPQDWLIDLRPALLDAQFIDRVAEAFWTRFRHEMPFQIGGMEVAAVPLITALQLRALNLGLHLNAFIIRKQRKQHGAGQRIEGVLTDAPIVLVDDLVNSGASLEAALVALNDRATGVSRVFTVIDFQSEAGRAWSHRRRIRVDSLFHPRDVGLALGNGGSKELTVPWRTAWKFGSPSGDPFHMVPKSAPVLNDGAVYFGDDTGAMRCLDAERGTERWRFDVRASSRKGIWSTCALQGSRLYFGAYNGRLYSLNVATGTPIWENAACEWIGSSPVITLRHSALLIGLEYERARARGSIAAFALDDGRKLWEHWLPEYQHGSGAYSDALDVAVFGTNSNRVVALDPSSGEARWTLETRGPVKSAPAIDEARGLVALASFDHCIHIAELGTGAKVATFRTDGLCYTTPLIVGNFLFCGSSDRGMHVIDLERMLQVRRIDVGARVFSSPRPLGDRIVFGTTSGKVICLDQATLTIRTVAQVPDAITNAVAVDPNGRRIYVPTYTNEVYAFDADLAV